LNGELFQYSFPGRVENWRGDPQEQPWLYPGFPVLRKNVIQTPLPAVLRENSASQLISLDLWVSGLHASGMKILLMMAVVQSLNLVIFGWSNRVAGLRVLVLRQQFAVYMRKPTKPML